MLMQNLKCRKCESKSEDICENGNEGEGEYVNESRNGVECVNRGGGN